MGDQFSHLDESGRAQMVDVSGKQATAREAVARVRVLLGPIAFAQLQAGHLVKGDALGVARLAGIQAAKKTAELIPLCHPLPLSFAGVELVLDESESAVEITTTCRTTAETGVEMEALTAASVAALALYDMCKALDKRIRITDLRLIRKSGGKSGLFVAE